MKLQTSLAAITLISASVIASVPAYGDEYRPCSFNYQVIACKATKVRGGIRITWRDDKTQVYYGVLRNNNYLEDSLGGQWKFIDFSMGASWSLSNTSNGNVIIWNGTYREYGSYVGLN